MAENEALRTQLSDISERVDTYSERLAELSESDQELYRTIFEAESISGDLRQVGVGGSDPYENYGRFSSSTASLLQETSQKLDRLERQINLQNASYRELTSLANERTAELRQMPAILPADGPVVSGFGMRRHPVLGVRKMHYGLDVLVDAGSPVVSSGAGIVRETEFSASYGNYVMIDHEATGYTTLYAHLSEIESGLRPGRRVERGDVVGYSGSTGRSTGPHVHYEVRDGDGRAVNPVQFFAPSMTPAEYERLVEQTENSTISLD